MLLASVVLVAAAGSFGVAWRFWPDGGGFPPAQAAPRQPLVRQVPSKRLTLAPLIAVRQTPPAHRFQPPLSASGAVLVDADSGTVLWAKGPHASSPDRLDDEDHDRVLALERLRPEASSVAPSVPRAAPVPRRPPLRRALRRGSSCTG